MLLRTSYARRVQRAVRGPELFVPGRLVPHEERAAVRTLVHDRDGATRRRHVAARDVEEVPQSFARRVVSEDVRGPNAHAFF